MGFEKVGTRYRYSTSELDGLDHLAGRVVINYLKPFRQSYCIGKKYINSLVVSAILPERMSMSEFPGYSKVLLTFDELKHVTSQALPQWLAALKNMAGVYIITDTTNGKQYIGSAHGSEGIWSRWSNYAKDGHGGNVELKAILNDEALHHAQHFQYAILEICDPLTSREEILLRESHWKSVLKTREFGYNRN